MRTWTCIVIWSISVNKFKVGFPFPITTFRLSHPNRESTNDNFFLLQALNAQAAGAIGIILYSDPADYANEGVSVYPDDWWLPDTGAQRGNVFVSDAKGDPITPGYPATRTSNRFFAIKTI